jgi:prepilin-type N-terminal cleavage/methylation domain-containing protein
MKRGYQVTGGFTLAEVLVTMAIVAVLAVLGQVVGARMIEYGRAAGCVQNLRQIGVGLQRYLGDHDNRFPQLAAGRSSLEEQLPVLDTELAPYLGDKAVFKCPSDRGGLAERTGTSYFWNNLVSGQNAADMNFLGNQDITHIPLVSDKEAFHPYQQPRVNLLYADGRATSQMQFFTE